MAKPFSDFKRLYKNAFARKKAASATTVEAALLVKLFRLAVSAQ